MRKKFFAALAASALVAATVTGSALAETFSVSKTFYGYTYTCNVEYTESDLLPGISSYDELRSITSIVCTKSPAA